MEILSNSYSEEKISYDKWAEIEVNGEKYNVHLAEIKPFKELAYNVEYEIDYMPVVLHEKTYFLYTRNKTLYITSRINKIWQRKSKLFSHIGKKFVYFYGLYSDISHKFPDCDYVYLEDNLVTKIVRPFKKGKLRHLAIIKLPFDAIKEAGQVHTQIFVGDANGNKRSITLKKKHKGINYYSRKRVGDDYFLVRTVIASANARIVSIPMSPEYTKMNLFKNAIACFIGKIIGHTNSALMFEKETNRACESGYYVFEKIMSRKEVKSKVFFVIDKKSPDYAKVYAKYPKNTIAKYSFKHYLYIYLSKYFISSELSNHVINPRLYIRSINKEIARKRLVFLQHGIMFAKPVDNPAAAGFRKKNKSVNYYKSVISSDLEATQFYKCGFNDNDLIKCGLPKLDTSYINESADKIMVMLTYRYWEEALMMHPDTIADTTYYKTYMNIIEEFKKAGLIDKLIISCHPKFAECILEAAPEYESIVEKDVNKAIENSRVFITDYSSASYDAHYRGAYIIYYWKERDYLIENYRAIPPVNEDNCDGVPVFSDEVLIEEVKKAIEKNFVMDPMYEERYTKINEFHDGKNGERLVDALIELNVI